MNERIHNSEGASKGEIRLFSSIAKSDYWLHHVCLFFHSDEHLGSHWTDFHEI